MTAYEEVQCRIAEDVKSRAGDAKEWHRLAQGDQNGYAPGYALKSYKAFSNLLMEDYISHKCHQLPASSVEPLDERILLEIQKIDEVLDRYAASAVPGVLKRLELMRLINANSNESITDELPRTVRRMNQVRSRNMAVGPREDFTSEVAQQLCGSAYNIKTFIRDYIEGNGVLHAVDNASVSDQTEVIRREPNSRIGLRRGSLVSQRDAGEDAMPSYHPALVQKAASTATASEQSRSEASQLPANRNNVYDSGGRDKGVGETIRGWLEKVQPPEPLSPYYGLVSSSQSPDPIPETQRGSPEPPTSAQACKRPRPDAPEDSPSAKRRHLTEGRQPGGRGL